MKRIVAALWAASACASATGAVPVTTLDEALAAAGATSPAVEAAGAGLRAAQAGRTIAGLRPNPSVDAMSENIAGTGIYSGLSSSETTVSLAVPVELGRKRSARIAVADAQIGRAALDAAIAQADLRLRVVQAYNSAVAAQRRAELAHEQVRIATGLSHAAGVRVSAGRASPLEQQRADVSRIEAEGAAERADRTAKVASENLGRLIGRPVTVLDADWFARLAPAGPVTAVDPEGTLAAAAARADVATAGAQLRLARSQRVPDLTLSAGAKRLEASNDTAAVVGLSIPLPLFNGGRANVSLANAQRDRADAMRRAATLDTFQAIESTRAELANAATTARNTAGPSLAAAQEAARIARIGYREGKFGQLDLLEAERTLSQTRSAAIDALAAYHDAVARFERLTAPAPEPMKDSE